MNSRRATSLHLFYGGNTVKLIKRRKLVILRLKNPVKSQLFYTVYGTKGKLCKLTGTSLLNTRISFFLAVIFLLSLLNRVNCLFDRKTLVMTSELYENFLLVNKEAR